MHYGKTPACQPSLRQASLFLSLLPFTGLKLHVVLLYSIKCPPNKMHRWKDLLMERFKSMDRENLQLGIQFAYLRKHLVEGALPRAAVAFIIKASKENLYVLLTKRSSSLRNYGGDVCLPGGRYDPSDDNLVNTALRETKEEVGIDSQNLDYICTMFTIPAGLGKVIAVTPVVFLAKDELDIKINTSEVEMAFWVPLDVFFNENTRMPKSHVHNEGKKLSTVSFSYFDAENQTTFLIWGFTARVCVTAASIALNKAPHFPFTIGTLVYSPSDGSAALAEVVMRQQSSNDNKHVYLHSKL